MMQLGVRRSKHALPCAQHPAPMTISSTEGRYGIMTWRKIMNVLAIQFDEKLRSEYQWMQAGMTSGFKMGELYEISMRDRQVCHTLRFL